MTSNTKLTPTQISFNFSLQTSIEPNTSLILESDLSYAQSSPIVCSISSSTIPCKFTNNKAELDLTTLPNIKNGYVFIDGLSVGIQANSIAVFTYDNKNEGYIDSVVFANPYTY